MADGDVLGILLLAQKQYQLAFLSGLHMFALSLFPIFPCFPNILEHVCTTPLEPVPLIITSRLGQLQLSPAKVLDISAFRRLQFCAGFRCLLGPWNET